MATECFKIEWTGYYSLNKANSRPEARKLGLYAVYKFDDFDERILWYIGKSKEIRTRLGEYRREWQHGFSLEQINELRIAIGVLTSLDGEPVNQEQLKDVESLFLNVYHPEGNAKSTMQGYMGRSALVVSTGKIGELYRITTHDKKLLKLLEKSIADDWDS